MITQKKQSDKNETKIENRREVLDTFRKGQIITVAEVSSRSGLSKATVHRVVEFLQKKKLVLPAGKGVSGDEGGKKPILFTFNAGYKYVLCYQILANALLSGISDMRGNFLAEQSVTFANDTPLETVLEKMHSAFDDMASHLHLGLEHFAGVVIGSHGITNAEEGIVLASPYFPSWGANIPLVEMVQKLFDRPIAVYIDNSNRYNAYAEMRAGQAQESGNFIVIDGELHGVGAGIVINGILWRGNHFLSGEIGHLTVDPTGKRKCTCGNRGCLETMASMNSLINNALEGAKKNSGSLLAKKIAGGSISHRDIYDIANAGDDFARSVVEEQARWLAIAIGSVSLIADPDVVILQGPYARGGAFFLERLNYFINHGGLPQMPKNISLRYSGFDRQRGLIGGAHFVADKFYSDMSLYNG